MSVDMCWYVMCAYTFVFVGSLVTCTMFVFFRFELVKGGEHFLDLNLSLTVPQLLDSIALCLGHQEVHHENGRRKQEYDE